LCAEYIFEEVNWLFNDARVSVSCYSMLARYLDINLASLALLVLFMFFIAIGLDSGRTKCMLVVGPAAFLVSVSLSTALLSKISVTYNMTTTFLILSSFAVYQSCLQRCASQLYFFIDLSPQNHLCDIHQEAVCIFSN
jgi:hypothetical protein